MTQYTEEVAQVARKRAVEKWAKCTQYISAQHGYVETALNDGSVTREYHRDYEDHRAGDKIFLSEAMPIEELMNQAPRDL